MSITTQTITIPRQFRGPPNSGNGGYVCGILGNEIHGPATVALRAIIPLDTPLNLNIEPGHVTLTGTDGTLIAEARRAEPHALVPPPSPPALEQARAAHNRFPFIEKPFHPPCFTCSSIREEGDALRIFTGQIEGAEAGHLAGIWKPHANFADNEGFAKEEIVWAALDCPGSVAWIVRMGSGGGLLGTMTGEILRRPKTGEETIVTAWPLEQSGRKYVSGVALFTANGELLARGHQIWIGRPPATA